MNVDKYDPFKPAPPFVQTGKAAIPELDHWEQIADEEINMVVDMTRRNELSGGTPIVRQFEKEWREWIGAKFAVTVINGTSALYSAYFGLGVGPGDEVICPVNTWICTIAPALLLGAKPVFCDIDPDSLMIDPENLRAKITPNTRCICAVHLWGNVCDLDPITAIAQEHNIPIIEDCSHAHGAQYKGKMCGAIGHAACWSLQGSKAVSAGEGGVLTTNNTDVFERACLIGQVNRIAGIDLVGAKYAELQPLGLGMKFRAHPLGIGIALVQLHRLAGLNERRAAFIEQVEAGLDDIPGLRPIKVYEGAQRGGYYGFPVIYEPTELNGLPMQSFVEALNKKGISATTSPYPNLHDLPLFAKGFDIFTRNRGPLCASEGYTGYQKGDFPNAERAETRTIFLPRPSNPIPNAANIVLDTLRQTANDFR